jgi:hypothetical protein
VTGDEAMSVAMAFAEQNSTFPLKPRSARLDKDQRTWCVFFDYAEPRWMDPEIVIVEVDPVTRVAAFFVTP